MWIQDYEGRESVELRQEEFLYGQHQKTFIKDELFTMKMRGRSMVGKLSLLDDVHFNLETITKVIEDTLASESKEYQGIKLETVEDLDITERHKVVEISNVTPR